MAIRKIAEIELKAGPYGRSEAVGSGFKFYSYDKDSAAIDLYFRNQDGSPTDIMNCETELMLLIKEDDEQKKITVIDSEVEIVSALKGHARYVIPDKLRGYVGLVEGYVYLSFPDNSRTDECRFDFTIERSLIEEEFENGGEYYIKDIQTIFDEVKNALNSKIPEMQTEYDYLVMTFTDYANEKIAEYDSRFVTLNSNLLTLQDSLTTAQNKVTTLEQSITTANTNLNTRIDEISKKIDDNDVFTKTDASKFRADIAEVTAQLAQNTSRVNRSEKIQMQGASFVDKLLPLINVRSIYVKNNSTNDGIDVGINLEDSLDSVIEYNFRYNVDKLLLLRGAKTGSVLPSREYITPKLNGDFVDGAGAHYHTVTIGDSFEFEFTGTELEFRLPTESRGLWEFKLSNGQFKRISCYSSSAVLQGKQMNVFSGLDYGTYNVEAIFLGDDPDNPPTSSPARGYLYNADSSWTLREENRRGFLDVATAKNLISPNTIPDFAIAAKPDGQSYSHAWVPYHTVSDVSVNPIIKVIVDGNDVITIPGNALQETYHNVNSFEIIQSFDAHNPNGTQGAMWKHYISHIITNEKPLCTINNRLEVLQDTSVASAYLTMSGVDSTNINRLVLNNGVEYNTVPNDGSEIQFDYDVSSALYAGEYATGRTHVTAIDIESYSEAVGLKNRSPNDNSLPGLLTFRTDNIAKFYLRSAPNNSVLKTGTVLKNTQRLACITGVKFPNTLLKTI